MYGLVLRIRREILAPGLLARVILIRNVSDNILENTKIFFSEQARGDKTIEGFHVPSGVLVRAPEFFENKLDLIIRFILLSRNLLQVRFLFSNLRRHTAATAGNLTSCEFLIETL